MTFFQDINVHWYLPPLIVAISLVYSATRFEGWDLILHHSVRWAVYILTFLGGVYGLLLLVHWMVSPYWIGAIVVLGATYFYLSGRSKPASGKL